MKDSNGNNIHLPVTLSTAALAKGVSFARTFPGARIALKAALLVPSVAKRRITAQVVRGGQKIRQKRREQKNCHTVLTSLSFIKLCFHEFIKCEIF